MIIEPELTFIKEPLLSFGYGQKTSDPRDGLMLYGAFDREKRKGQINIGIIGCLKQREYLKTYLKKIHQPVQSNSNDVARPFFAGLESVFGIHINFKNIQEINISDDEINKYLHYTDGYQRVHNLSKLYADELIKYSKQEEVPVTVWFVVISDEIYKYGRPNSKLPKSAENIKIGLSKKDRVSKQTLLFDDFEELHEAHEYEINFHNQIKAKLLDDKIVTQIIKESTIAYEHIWEKEDKILKQRIFDSAKAWNISTTLYYKVGGLPWRLGDVREDVCYLGLVYKKLDND